MVSTTLFLTLIMTFALACHHINAYAAKSDPKTKTQYETLYKNTQQWKKSYQLADLSCAELAAFMRELKESMAQVDKAVVYYQREIARLKSLRSIDPAIKRELALAEDWLKDFLILQKKGPELLKEVKQYQKKKGCV